MSLSARTTSSAPGNKVLSEASRRLNQSDAVPPPEGQVGKTTQERFQEFKKRQQLAEKVRLLHKKLDITGACLRCVGKESRSKSS